jgi:hypothetical protein
LNPGGDKNTFKKNPNVDVRLRGRHTIVNDKAGRWHWQLQRATGGKIPRDRSPAKKTCGIDLAKDFPRGFKIRRKMNLVGSIHPSPL